MLRSLTLTLFFAFSMMACKAGQGDLCFTNDECGDAFQCCKATVSVSAAGACEVTCTTIIPSDATGDTAAQDATRGDVSETDAPPSDVVTQDIMAQDVAQDTTVTPDASTDDTGSSDTGSGDVGASDSGSAGDSASSN